MRETNAQSLILDTLILAGKKFHSFEFIRLANFILASLADLHYNIHKNTLHDKTILWN